MRIVLLGPPGTGKGSLASLCSLRLGVTHMSTGDLFRQEMARDTSLGRRVRSYVSSGRLVPDALVLRVMAACLRQQPLNKGFVLDGFPRTKGQAAGLDRTLRQLRRPIDGAIYLRTPESVLIRRLSGRRICTKCGANYNVRTMRPKRAGRCDRCQGSLIIRKDDQPETIRKRLAIDRQIAKALLRYYRQRSLRYDLDGRGGVETVFMRALKLFRRQGWIKERLRGSFEAA